MAAAMTGVFNMTRSTITVPTITVTAIAMNTITPAIARISECRCCGAGEQKATRNDRGSQKALHGSNSSFVFSGPGNDPRSNQHEGD